MRFFHLSDLHLGLRLAECSLLEDQVHILQQVLALARREKPDGVLIAGDVYDKAVPPAEAVALFDWFLVELSGLGLKTFVISGNHDSPERIAFGGKLTEKSGVYFSPVYDGHPLSVRLRDEYGPLTVHLLPFIKPAHLRRFHPEETLENYTDALRLAVADLGPAFDPAQRNIVLAHQFLTGASRTDSEEASVGGLDNADSGVFACFDYAALGHIHRPQAVGRPETRYCGSPLAYSFSEAGEEKSVTILDCLEKGRVELRCEPLIPLRRMRAERGRYDELMARAAHEDEAARQDYLAVTLTDEEDIPEAIGRLRAAWPNLLKLNYDNTRARAQAQVLQGAAQTEDRSPLQLFEELYQKQNGRCLNEEQRACLQDLIAQVWEEDAL